MLTVVEVQTAQGQTLALPLEDVSDGYIIEDIEGLDPVDAEIVSSAFAQLDGTQYQASRRENRNIVLKLGLEPDYVTTTVQTLRSNLYRYFMPKSFVRLRFYIDDVLFAYATGRVESLTTPLFTAEPQAHISVVCFDPDFIAPDSVVVAGSTVSTTTEQEVLYSGTIETGFVFKMTLNRSLSEFSINNTANSGVAQTLQFESPLISGDQLEISTIDGNKGAWYTRSGTRRPILYGVAPLSSWVNFFPGSNKLRVAAGGAAIPFTIEYAPRYGGL